MEPDTLIASVFRLSPAQKTALKKLRLETLRDLLYHFPSRYQELLPSRTVSSVRAGERVSLAGELKRLSLSKARIKKITLAEGVLADTTGSIKLVWFNQPYLAKMLTEGSHVRVTGTVQARKGELYIGNPDVERLTGEENADSLFGGHAELFALPVYPESRGISSRWFLYAVQKLMEANLPEHIADPVPGSLLTQYHLPGLAQALRWIHKPKKESFAEAARKRFAFEEVFYIQLEKQRERRALASERAATIAPPARVLQEFTARFPFTPTRGQTSAISAIVSDIGGGRPMSRLLEGDVGSGKTAVAAATAYATVNTRPPGQDFGTLQVAYMAPTEILATQHFETFIQYFRHLPVNIALLTGSGCRKFPSKVNPSGWTTISRTQLLKWVANGEIAVLVGTHALIQKAVRFKHLAYVIIDEQHRFGVKQRKALLRGLDADRRGKDAEVTLNSTDNNNTLLYRDLTYRVREALFTVRKELGLGHKEAVYQRAMAHEFTRRNIPFNQEVSIPIFYQQKNVGVYRPDFVIDEKIVLELKALPILFAQEKKQLWQYLKGSTYRLGLLVNFGHTELTIARIVYDQARSGSASSPRFSAYIPHLLSMTATPIPRTLALTLYGDLDLTLLDEMPAGRKQVITELVGENRKKMYEHMRKELASDRQVYIICPRIDEPDPTKELALEAKSAKAEAMRLKKEVFPEYEIGVLHSKLKPAEKDRVMSDFKDGHINILVSTSVVEVGVNVPNATVIAIEGAERFGLAQLHQLRGRVLRSTHQAYCYLLSESSAGKAKERLTALSKAKNGFELAEMDLKLRGPGSLSGENQWGLSDIGMEALKNLKMVEAARLSAARLISEDPNLIQYPLLQEAVASRTKSIHWE